MPRYIDIDALWRDVTSNIEDCGDVLEIIEKQQVVTINDLAEENKVTKCNHKSSAQPTYTDAEIQKMQDLEQAQIEKAYQLGYEEGKRDAQSESCRGCRYEPRCSHEEPCGSCSNNYVNKYEGRRKGMADMMTFPETVDEYMEQYKITDTKQIYTNGAELVPIFRMKQWFEHKTDRMKFVQEAVNTLMNTSKTDGIKDKCFRNAARFVQNAIDGKPQDYELIPDDPEQHWIPWNSGKPPKESGTYPITAYDGVDRRVTYAKYQKRLKRWELTVARAYWRVLAWMPEPEPCEGDVK